MLATWTGANIGASASVTRCPVSRSMISNSSAAIVRHAPAGAAATTSFGLIGFDDAGEGGGAAATATSGSRRRRNFMFRTCHADYACGSRGDTIGAPFQRKCGAVAEWSKALAWKVSIRQKRIEGSNPSRSANDPFQRVSKCPEFLDFEPILS